MYTLSNHLDRPITNGRDVTKSLIFSLRWITFDATSAAAAIMTTTTTTAAFVFNCHILPHETLFLVPNQQLNSNKC